MSSDTYIISFISMKKAESLSVCHIDNDCHVIWLQVYYTADINFKNTGISSYEALLPILFSELFCMLSNGFVSIYKPHNS